MGAILGIVLPALIQGVQEAPELIDDAKKAWSLLTDDTPATPDQQQQFDDAMEEAHSALQASVNRQD